MENLPSILMDHPTLLQREKEKELPIHQHHVKLQLKNDELLELDNDKQYTPDYNNVKLIERNLPRTEIIIQAKNLEFSGGLTENTIDHLDAVDKSSTNKNLHEPSICDSSSCTSLHKFLKLKCDKGEVSDDMKRQVKSFLNFQTKKKLISILVEVLGLEEKEKIKSENCGENQEVNATFTKARAQKPTKKTNRKSTPPTDSKEVKNSVKTLKKRPRINNDTTKEETDSSNCVPGLGVQVKTLQKSPASKSFFCKACNLSFTRRSLYQEHSHSHTSSMKCNICDKIFKSKDSLYHHQRGLHGKEKPYKCTVCDSYFSFHHSYKLHLQRHKGERPFSCKLCPKTYLTSSHLKEHMRAVHLESTIICHVCGKKFSYNSALKLHLQIHLDDTTYNCPTCDKEFHTKRALKRHSVHHLENKRVKCDVCGKYFKSDHYLNIHSKIHSNKFDKSYHCDTCGKSFFYRCTLDSHIQTHNKFRSFPCVICNKTFKSKASLYSHKYVHNEGLAYLCVVCSKSFKTKSCLNAHVKRHENKKTFVCSKCGKTFPDKGGLSKHTKTVHSPSKYYSCKICERTGTRADNMRTHVKSHRNQIGSGDDPMNYILCMEEPKSRTHLSCDQSNENKDGSVHFSNLASVGNESITLANTFKPSNNRESLSRSSNLLEKDSSFILPANVDPPSDVMSQKYSNCPSMKLTSNILSSNGEYCYRNLSLGIQDSYTNISSSFYQSGLSENNSSLFSLTPNVPPDIPQANSSFDKFPSSYAGQYAPVENAQSGLAKSFDSCGIDWLTATSSPSGIADPVE